MTEYELPITYGIDWGLYNNHELIRYVEIEFEPSIWNELGNVIYNIPTDAAKRIITTRSDNSATVRLCLSENVEHGWDKLSWIANAYIKALSIKAEYYYKLIMSIPEGEIARIYIDDEKENEKENENENETNSESNK